MRFERIDFCAYEKRENRGFLDRIREKDNNYLHIEAKKLSPKLRTVKDSFDSTLPTDQKNRNRRLNFLRSLCYNKSNNFKEDKEDAYDRCD